MYIRKSITSPLVWELKFQCNFVEIQKFFVIKCIRDACLHHHICPLVKWLSPEKFPRTPFKSQQQQQCQEFSINQKNESWNTFLHTFTLENSPKIQKNNSKSFMIKSQWLKIAKNISNDFSICSKLFLAFSPKSNIFPVKIEICDFL